MANDDLKIDLAHQLGRAVTEQRKPIYERDEHTLLDVGPAPGRQAVQGPDRPLGRKGR